METHVQLLRIGPFSLVRPLHAGRLAERWLAVNEGAHSAHVAHRFRMGDRAEERRLVAAVESLSRLSHQHILPVEQFTLGIAGAAWVVTPFTGSHDGLVTLARLVQDKGGRMPASEVDHALAQLLEAVEYAHECGVQHGELHLDEIVVDRRGSLAIEHYGLQRRLSGSQDLASEVIRDEVRSIVELGYTLLTGLSAEEPRIVASRLIPRLDRRWDEWFEEGLDPMLGFASAAEALGALPGSRRGIEGRGGSVVTVISRVRRALRPI
jgi:serine/threonine protein kinase